MDFTFFRDFTRLNYCCSIHPGTVVGDPRVVDIRALKYSDGIISYKLMHSDPWQPLPHRSPKVVIILVAWTVTQGDDTEYCFCRFIH